MAILDYVIMSEFARLDPSGLVTIVGGSFDRVQATQHGAGQQLFITLRALLEEALRMMRRGVSENDVRQCLNEHVQRLQTAKQNQYKGDVGGRILKVWVAPDRDTDLARFIVSVAWEDDNDDS